MNVIELTQALVRIPSENPNGTEAEMANFVADWLSRLPGAEIDVREVLPGRPNVIGRLKGKSSARPLALLAHMDTVPVGANWTERPFGGDIHDGKLFGRGSCDMKSGLAVAMMAFANACNRQQQPTHDILIGATMDEEGTRMLGVNALVDWGVIGKDAFVIATEPSDLTVSIAHKGLLWAELSVKGKAAHAGNPHFGADAIRCAAEFIHHFGAAVRALAHDHPALGKATATFSRISGGIKTNVVPDTATVEMDVRLPPPMTLQDIHDMIAISAKASESAVPGTAITFRQINNDRPPVEADLADPTLKALAQSVRSITGAAEAFSSFPAYTDASVVQARTGNTTSIVFGPGLLAQAHTADEFVPVDQIEKAQQVLDLFIRETYFD